MEKQIRDALIKFIRANTKNKMAKVSNAFGDKQKMTILPLWYADTVKLCYPKEYFNQSEIDAAVKTIEDRIKQNNLNLKVEVEANYPITSLHTSGWKIKISEKE